MNILNRNNLSVFLNNNNLTGIGAEVGVKNGRFSNKILNKWHGELLYSIDCWSGDDPTKNKRYVNTKNLLEKHKNRSKIIIATSERARRRIKNNSLDFCYIDADHNYQKVKKDINWWWVKIKKGGILCGHDYGYNFKPREEWPWPGVRKAVDEFCKQNKLAIYTDTENHQKALSWYIKK